MGTLKARLAGSARPAAVHLACSLTVAALAAVFIFKLWYPVPFSALMGGSDLFGLLISVDVVCGPLLTLMLVSPTKPIRERWTDLSAIVLLQLAALIYGLSVVYGARPVFIGFEGDRFRVVRAIDVDVDALDQAPARWRQLPQLGPVPLGVRLAQSTDADFYDSIKLALEGIHPSMRPDRWLPYDHVREAVRQSLKDLGRLEQQHQGTLAWESVQAVLSSHRLRVTDLGYLPLLAERHTDWIVLVDRSNGFPVAYAHLDGW